MFIIKEISKINNLNTVTILGDGNGIFIDTVLRCENNIYRVLSVAMKQETKDTTILVLDNVENLKVGNCLFIVQKDAIEKEVDDIIAIKKNILDKDIPAIDKDREFYNINENNDLHIKSWERYYDNNFDINTIGVSDKVYLSKYGLISPNGDWYSCSFGGHYMKALCIVEASKKLTKEFTDYLVNFNKIKENDRENCQNDIFRYGLVTTGMGTALDFLMSIKWCKISYTHDNKIQPVVLDDIRGMTKSQIRTYNCVEEFFKREERD
jgi:hypothetical protein